MKKLISILLVTALCLGLLAGAASAWDEEHMTHVIMTGTDTEDIIWRLTTDYVLRIEGPGAIQDRGCGDEFNWWRARALTESIVFADGITAIGSFAFEDGGARRVWIPASVTRIGKAAFYGAEELTDVYYAGTQDQWNAISIGASNGALTNAKMHFNCGNTWIGTCGYYSSGSTWPGAPRWVLEGTTLTVTAQGAARPDIYECEYYFIRTEANQWIDLSPRVQTLVLDGGVNATIGPVLGNFTALKTIQVNSGNPSLKAVGGVLFTKDGKTLLRFPAGSGKTAYTVPAGTKKLNSYAFMNCKTLKSVTVPASVTEIGFGVFAGSGVKDIYFKGTQSQWEAVSGHDRVNGAAVHFSGGSAAPTPTAQPQPTEKPAATGWQKISGKWYYFQGSGAMAKGWQKIGRSWYYFASSGAMQTGWQKISGKWYYFAASGAMQTGWMKSGRSWYYFASSGAMQTGWQKISGKWYYFQSSGAMSTGWQKIGRSWYYFQSSGVMQTGWMKSGGAWYYFKSSGAMAAGETIGRYTFDSSGRWVA